MLLLSLAVPGPPLHARDELFDRARALRSSLTRGQDVEQELAAFVEELLPRIDGSRDAARALMTAARTLAGVAQKDPSRREDALRYYRHAASGARAAKEWRFYCYFVQTPANLCIQQGERIRGEALLREALTVLPPDEPSRATVMAQLVELLLYREQWDDAHAVLDEAEALLPGENAASGSSFRQAIEFLVHGLRAQAFLRTGLLDQAAVWIEKEKEIVDTLPADQAHLRFAYDVHRADFLLAAESWELAVNELRNTLARAGPPHPARVSLLVRLGVALSVLERMEPDRPQEAESIFREVLSLDPPAPAHERRTAELRLVHLYLSGNRLGDAAALLDEMARNSRGRAADRETDVDTAGSGSILEDAHLTALEARLQRLRGGNLAAPLGRVRDALERLFTRWESLEVREAGVGFLQTSRVRVVLSELIQLNRAHHGDHEGVSRSMEILLRAQGLSSMARRLNSPRATVEEVRTRLLPPGVGLLLYLPSRDASHVFALDREILIHEQLPSRQSLDRIRRQLLGAVVVPPFSLAPERRAAREKELEDAARLLAGLLLPASIRDRIREWSSITVVAPDLLGYLPFECLRIEGQRYLGIEKAIGYLPSLPLGLSLASRQERRAARRYEAQQSCLVVAAPRHADGLPDPYARLEPIVFGSEEADLLMGAYPEDSVEMLTGDRANFGAIAGPTLAEARVVHFLVHGVHNYRLERTAGILLGPSPSSPDSPGDDGLVWIDRLRTLDPPELVLMTACGTGRGPVRRGDSGISHLGGVFLERGAASVVLPYAELAYRPTLELSGAFHRFLRDGFSVVESLRRAREEIASQEAYRDPFYHAMLHARGLPHHVLFPRPAGALRAGSAVEGAEGESPTWWKTVALMALPLLVGCLALATRRRIRARRHHRSRESG